ncbi:hypothetical protein L210DRAFT_3703595 [Boletus edulis BED1]|uniref:Uncharacterized protein n=1 Tax=Boletus edulis BED1 TaxID=1328754 RepID=A0AAD4C6A5_BOLED|nr:hypothetical protein L210DRAFT_3703595 [Boletus edulis BED1]
MSRYTPDSSDFLCSDDSNASDLFPSSPTSHRFTSPPPPECQDVPGDNDLIWMASKRRTLPLELIEYIIKLFHRRYRSFRALRPLSETNSQFRTIALRTYMTSLSIQSAKQLTSLLKVHMSMPSRTEGGPTQKIRSTQIFITPLMNSPMTHLTSLTLTHLWYIDVLLLSMVSGAFPGLRSLHLSCSEHLDLSCCWGCFEESSSAVVHSPIPNHFRTVASLTSAFGKALKPLTKLIDLHLGIFLSDEEILEDHIDHYDSPRVYSRALRTTFGQNRNPGHTGAILSQSESLDPLHLEHVSYREDEEDQETVANIVFDEVPPFPHGPELCPICSIVVSSPDVRTRELEASLALALKLKSLRTIGWSSFFAWKLGPEDERRIGDWQRTTKTYILRSGGRVRVRRRPWG